jgi:hypothetical protein
MDGGNAENAAAFFGHANESPPLSWIKLQSVPFGPAEKAGKIQIYLEDMDFS